MSRDYEALGAFIMTRQGVPFDFGRGRNDCVGFAIGAICAMSGRKHGLTLIKGLRWQGERSAMRLALRHGGLAAAVGTRLQPIAPALALRGDVAGVPDESFPGGVRLMIVEGALLVGPGEHGNVRELRSAMTMAWSADLAGAHRG